MQTSIGACLQPPSTRAKRSPLAMTAPTGRVVTAGSNVDVRLPISAPWRSVTTDLPATLPLKATTPSARYYYAAVHANPNRDAQATIV